MKLIPEMLEEIIQKESTKPLVSVNFTKTLQLISDLKKAGLLKQPSYTLPLVDTIGKTYYGKINRRK